MSDRIAALESHLDDAHEILDADFAAAEAGEYPAGHDPDGEPAAHKYGAVNFGNLVPYLDKAKVILNAVDANLQKYGPVVEGMSPVQFQAYEALVLSIVHSINGTVNPGPAA